jgi:DNA-directed RNA polymerase subunit beta'
VVWDVLEEVIAEHPVLLNRAPTLHRLGIQAFEPLLIEGKAIQIHPLVCTAFNADFDGDQMAVHVPLSAEAQAEARILMLSSNNILSPASGRPLATPTQDMILGIFFLTSQREGELGEGRAFTSIAEALMAYEQRTLSLQAKIKIRLGSETRETTLGRALFNEVLPDDFGFVDSEVTKKGLSGIVDRLAETYPKVVVAAVLDQLKALGFYWATRAAATIGIEDVVTPGEKQTILDKYEADADKVQKQYDNGLITNDERRQELIEIWTEATAKIGESMET